MDTITTQADLTLDTLLQDATKVADLHILNKDIRKAMITNYEDDLLSYSQDSYLFSSQLIQANRLNSNVTTCMFNEPLRLMTLLISQLLPNCEGSVRHSGPHGRMGRDCAEF